MADKKLNEVQKVTDMAYVPVILADGSVGQIAKADLASVVAGVMGNPLGTVIFNSWEELNNHINNNMPNYTCQFFTSAWKAFDGQGFYGNLVQGFLIRVLTDNYLLFGIAQDGRLVFRRGNTSGWDAPSLIL